MGRIRRALSGRRERFADMARGARNWAWEPARVRRVELEPRRDGAVVVRAQGPRARRCARPAARVVPGGPRAPLADSDRRAPAVFGLVVHPLCAGRDQVALEEIGGPEGRGRARTQGVVAGRGWAQDAKNHG